jgi:uncharacterized membrane protein HdeD (DUF308 family)
MSTMTNTADAEAPRIGWGWLFAFGVVLVVLGVICLVNVVDATLVTVAIVGLLLIVGGIVQIVGALMGGGTTGRRILHGAIGVLYILVGIEIFADPLSGAVALTLVIAIFLIAEGILRIYSAIADSPPYRWLLVLLGVITILLGFWIWTGIPVSGVVIGFFVGFSLLMAGISWIAISWALRGVERDASLSAPTGA